MSIWTVFGILLLLTVMQLVGMRLQVRSYRNTVHRLHQLGNVGIGAMRGKLGPGHIVVIACDNSGTIVDGEVMKGMTIFSGFEKIPDIAGKSIYALKEEYMALPEKQRKRRKGYIQALEALELRLNPQEEPAEPSKGVEGTEG